MTITVDTNSRYVHARLVKFHENTPMGIRLSRRHDTVAPPRHTQQSHKKIHASVSLFFFRNIVEHLK